MRRRGGVDPSDRQSNKHGKFIVHKENNKQIERDILHKG